MSIDGTAATDDGWGFVPAHAILKALGEDARLLETWEHFVRLDRSPIGMPGHAVVVGVFPRNGASPLLELLRGNEGKPYRMSPKAAADDGYELLAPPNFYSRWAKLIEAKAAERKVETDALLDRLLGVEKAIEAADVGQKEKQLAYSALRIVRKYAREPNLRLRSFRPFRRVTHCMNCREHLDSEIHILECCRCNAIICPSCGSCGCGDSRFPIRRNPLAGL